MADSSKFTTKQQRFIDFYCGNASDAARKAGYKIPGRSGDQNVKKREIREAIRKRQDKEDRPTIADRQTRQKFWSETMQDKELDYKHRLKASELLGKSEADFTDKIAGADGGPVETNIKIKFVDADVKPPES